VNEYPSADSRPTSGSSRRRVPGWAQVDREVLVAVEEIHAEMVSSVWKVLVQPGSEVAAGDTLVILESMKMEIPVLTEQAGTVRELHVVEGEVLQEGDLIATVDG
jgi:acetyl-CoA carboxylase biotin carboxyl carrier protein